MSRDDFRSKLKKSEAQALLKKISLLLKKDQGKVSFSEHFKKRVRERKLIWSPDALNVIHGGKIVSEAKLESKTGAYRYRIETKQMVLVIEFISDSWIRCISGWRKK